jgi:SnoaL-like domain
MILDSLSGLDRVHLLEVYARSVMLPELGRSAEWVELFLPEAQVRCGEAGEFKGREALGALARRLANGEFDLALGGLAPPLRTRHLLSNITLSSTDSRRASGHAVVTVTSIGGPEPPRWLASGRYTDHFAKGAEGCWRFERRMYIADRAGQPGTG